MHSTASDGVYPPEVVVERAVAAGLVAMALTDHDTLDGLPAALTAGERLGIRVVPGCEFSVAAPWGEMHLLGYFLPVGWPPLEGFLLKCRADRERRGAEMVTKLRALGLTLTLADLLAESDGAALGRPHVARALLRTGNVATHQEAFDKYIGWGRPGFVEKRLPTFAEVAALVHQGGGVVSAAHLKDRASRALLVNLKAEGLDGLEVRHPVHDSDVRGRLAQFSRDLGLLPTGGSDWHGDDPQHDPEDCLGGQRVPEEWLLALERACPPRVDPAWEPGGVAGR